jgi:hypothetical protein
MNFISIGAQCTTAALFQKLQLKRETLPFDWMFSTPQFVYTIIKLLLIDKKEIDDIVDNHFFVCDKKAYCPGAEHHILNEDGPVLVNSKYMVCFPHDTESDRDKYIRRMKRFKEYLLDTDNYLYFVYVSCSSHDIGNYTINGIEPIQKLYEYIKQINNILKYTRINYKILVFDTNKTCGVIPSDDIMYFDIEKKNLWIDLLPELIDKFNNLKNEGYFNSSLTTSSRLPFPIQANLQDHRVL